MNKGRKLPVEILTRDEVLSMFDELDPKPDERFAGYSDAMYCAILALLYRCGLRIAEVLGNYPKRDADSGLFLRDIDLEAGVLHVRHGKGDRSRRVGMDAGTIEYLRLWLKKRNAVHPVGGRVFLTRKGKQVVPWAVNRKMQLLADRAGIEKRVHPHGLRHTHACELMAEHVNPEKIRRQMGHSSLAVTTNYLNHLSPTEVIEVGKGREW